MEEEDSGSRFVIPEDVNDFFNCHLVSLRVYDISHGHAQVWSPWLIGQRIEGVWHTGVEVFGREYFYGGGVFKIRPGEITNTLGLKPLKSIFIGATAVSKNAFERFVLSISPQFTPNKYDLVNWNCNHFSDMLCRFLVDRGIPRHILELPQRVQSRFAGRLFLGCLQFMQRQRHIPAVTLEEERNEGFLCEDHSVETPSLPTRRPYRKVITKEESTTDDGSSFSDEDVLDEWLVEEDKGGGEEEPAPPERKVALFIDIKGTLPVGCPALSPNYPKVRRRTMFEIPGELRVFPPLHILPSSDTDLCRENSSFALTQDQQVEEEEHLPVFDNQWTQAVPCVEETNLFTHTIKQPTSQELE